MKVSRTEILSRSPHDPLANLIFTSMFESFKGEAMDQFLNEIDWSTKEELDVKLTLEGAELDIRKFCARLDKALDKAIDQKAMELVEEKLTRICDTAYAIEKGMKKIAKKELGIELDEYDYS